MGIMTREQVGKLQGVMPDEFLSCAETGRLSIPNRIGTSWVMPTDTQKQKDARAIRRTRVV